MNKATKINLTLLALALSANGLYAQQGFGTNMPSKASVIDMQSESKGLLIPRVSLTSLTVFLPISGEAATAIDKTNSLLVYNTATVGTNINPGYYYWTTDGTSPNSSWKRLLANDDASALALVGDVTGTLGATVVGRLQGTRVASTAPTSNEVLTYNGIEWTPTAITPAIISGKGTLTTQGGIEFTGNTNGTDKLLGSASIQIADLGVTTSKLATDAVTNSKLADNAVQTENIADNAVTIGKLPSGSSATTFLRGDGTWVTPTDTNTTYSGSSSITLKGTSFERAALTGDVTAPANSNATTIANNAVTSGKILDDAVTATKINTDVAGIGLIQATDGALQVNANNGLTVDVTSDAVQLGGNLTKATTITTTPINTLAIAGLQAGAVADNIMVINPSDNVVKKVKAVMPKFFYMPSIVFDISVVGTFNRNLYNEYINQFGTPMVSSSGSTEGIPTLLASQLEYYITYYDTNIFDNLVIDQNGVLTYRVKNSNASEKTFMNIVFVVKNN